MTFDFRLSTAWTISKNKNHRTEVPSFKITSYQYIAKQPSEAGCGAIQPKNTFKYVSHLHILWHPTTQ